MIRKGGDNGNGKLIDVERLDRVGDGGEGDGQKVGRVSGVVRGLVEGLLDNGGVDLVKVVLNLHGGGVKGGVLIMEE
uniref:hypothetical protein n=1 Tax=Neisseria sicca TaxID=490 RepID=UPI001C998F9F